MSTVNIGYWPVVEAKLLHCILTANVVVPISARLHLLTKGLSDPVSTQYCVYCTDCMPIVLKIRIRTVRTVKFCCQGKFEVS